MFFFFFFGHNVEIQYLELNLITSRYAKQISNIASLNQLSNLENYVLGEKANVRSMWNQ